MLDQKVYWILDFINSALERLGFRKQQIIVVSISLYISLRLSTPQRTTLFKYLRI